jgi:hypothetical protein
MTDKPVGTADSPFSNHGAWDILRQFASSDMTLPQAEEKLLAHLGDRYKDADWRPALKAIMDAEGDVTQAQDAVQAYAATCERPKLVIKLPASRPRQVVALENDLMESVEELKARKRVFGPLPSIDDLISPIEEKETSEDSPHAFPGGDHEIVGQVQHEIQVQKGEVIEVDDDDSDEEGDLDINVSRRDTIDLVTKLERLSIKFGGNSTLDLTRQLRKFRGFLHHEELLHAKQSSLEEYFPVA